MNQLNSKIHNTNQNLTFIEWLNSNKEILLNIVDKNQEGYISKWWHIITNNVHINVKDKEAMKLVSIFCEFVASYHESINMYNPYAPIQKDDTLQNNIKKMLSELNAYLSKKETPRVKVVGKVYNYITGFMEYELSDGNFVKIMDNKVEGPIKKFDIAEFFPDEFLSIVSPSYVRDKKIGQILD
jgi:hypothetical protein